MVKVKQDRKHERNPILFFLFAVVIPLIVALGIAVVVLSIAGFDVVGWVKDKGANTPVISAFIPSNEEKDVEKKLVKANETIDLQREEIDDLNKEITSLENIIEDLEMDITKLENRSKDDEDEANNSENVDEEVKQAAASFRKMDPEKAAPIIQSLEKTTAVAILSHLSGDVRGGILGEMEPKVAADLTEQMTNR